MKKIVLILALLLGALAFLIFSKYREYESFKNSPVNIEKSKVFTISKGENWKKVAERLNKEKIISDKAIFGKTFFYYLLKEKKMGRALKTGEFEFSGKLLPMDVAKIIAKGKNKLYSFTLPEGYNMYDAAGIFKKIAWIENSDKFLEYCNDINFVKKLGWKGAESCEGLLFPSTYKFAKDVTMKKVMEKMADEMHSIIAKYAEKIKKNKIPKYDLINLASVIEKETGVRAEQPIIASVFLNRIRIGMKLQSDPTVIYGLLPHFNGNITRKNLLTDHPHSTYTRKGLPATPIAFPGENAIKSLLYPDTTKYLYFVGTNKGYHYFSKSLKEHNAAVDWYQLKRNRAKFHWNGKSQ